MKLRALFLLATGYTKTEVHDILGVSVSSMRRWEVNVEEYGTIIPPYNPQQSRPRIMDAHQMEALVDAVLESPETYLDELMDFVALELDVAISKTQLQAIIENAGFTYKLLRNAAVERDEEARAVFRRRMEEHILARMCVAVDESSKDDHTIYRRYGHSLSGTRAEVKSQFVRGDRYSILPAMSVDGFITTRVVEESVDGAEFFDFIVNDLVSHVIVVFLKESY